MYGTWTYTRIVPMREIEYLHHFADKDGHRVDPQLQGLPPEVRNLVTFKPAGDNHGYGIRLAGRSDEGDVKDGHGAVPRQDGSKSRRGPVSSRPSCRSKPKRERRSGVVVYFKATSLRYWMKALRAAR
jgi:hypothetical protein